MTRTILFGVLLALSMSAAARGTHASSHSTSHASIRHSASSHSSVSVHGYTKRDGTYVAPYHRSAPDHTKLNNWSSRGNVNPYTGKVGTKDPQR